jgi:hypothetical protein
MDNFIAEKKTKPMLIVTESSAARKPGESALQPRNVAAPRTSGNGGFRMAQESSRFCSPIIPIVFKHFIKSKFFYFCTKHSEN